MNDTSTEARAAFDYDTRLDIKYAPGGIVDVPALVAADARIVPAGD